MKLHDNCCHAKDSSSLITTAKLQSHIVHELHLHSDTLTLADVRVRLVGGGETEGNWRVICFADLA